MRSTLDIDEDVLRAAKELARREKRTAGAIISELTRRALTAPNAARTRHLLPMTGGNTETPQGLASAASPGSENGACTETVLQEPGKSGCLRHLQIRSAE